METLYDLALTAAVSGAFALAGGLLLNRMTAPRAASALPPFELAYQGLSHTDFVRSHDLGNFGEVLTLAILASDGWRAINGKPGTGPQGIDGVFLKPVAGGWRGLFVETKTNSGGYADKSMSDSKLIGNLQSLWATSHAPDLQAAYAALIDGLQTGSPAVGKALWRHILATGETHVTPLGRKGERLGEYARHDNRAMMDALQLGLREFDREGRYWSA